ncbi:hypothetical protein GCM10028819_45820 [Spirosoma humi]
MFIIVFTGTTPQGDEQTTSFGSIDLIDCLEVVTNIIRIGWTMRSIHLLDHHHPIMNLPVEAFDSCSFIGPFGELERQWNEQLNISQS